jgi:hypothetical protein
VGGRQGSKPRKGINVYYITLTKPNGELEYITGHKDLMDAYAKMPLYMKTYSPKVLMIVYRELH